MKKHRRERKLNGQEVRVSLLVTTLGKTLDFLKFSFLIRKHLKDIFLIRPQLCEGQDNNMCGSTIPMSGFLDNLH